MTEDPDAADPQAIRAAETLRAGAERLHEHLAAPNGSLPESYVLLGTARLLEELAASLRSGLVPHEHVIDAAVELCHHIIRERP